MKVNIEPKRADTKVVTGKVRLSYANIHEPRAMNDGQEPKYSCSIIIPKADKKTIKLINEAIQAAIERDKHKWGGKVPANLKLPLRDGDEDRPDDEAYVDSYFINANSTRKPEIVDIYGNRDLGPDEVYSGCYARVSLNFYGFNAAGNRGVGCGLGNIQKLEDGERLGGGFSSAADDFDFVDPLNAEDNDDFLS